MAAARDDVPLFQAMAAPGPTHPQIDRILDAAAELFQTFGLRKTTMEDVARQSGLGRATVYRRFPSKNDLITAVLLREARRFFARLDAAVRDLPTMEDRLVEAFVVAVKAVDEASLAARLTAVEPEVILPYATLNAGPIFMAARAFLASRLRAAQSDEEIGDFDPEIAAEIMIRLTHSLALMPGGRMAADEDHARAFARDYLWPIIARRGGT